MNLKALCVGFAALIALAGPAWSQPAEFSPDAFRAHVAFLADDLLEGREAGTRGYDLAARYVASQFEGLGLQPAGSESGWFQPVRFVRFATSGRPRLTVGSTTLVHGDGMILRPSPVRQPLQLEAPLVFAGYGLDLPAEGFDDYAGLDVAGKIVVVLNGTPRGTPSDVAAHLGSEKARMAARRGAVGLVVIWAGPEAESFGWPRYRAIADRPGTTWLDDEGRPFLPHTLRLSAVVGPEAAPALLAGSGRSLQAILREAARPGARLRGLALSATARIEAEAPTLDRFDSRNVLALLPGTDPALADAPVLLMAHLDGLGLTSEGEGDRIRNGAMDNATGVATLIEVARRMRDDPPRRPVLFAAVTAEEKGLLGAEYLAQTPSGGRVAAVVNLDMPILSYPFEDVVAFGAEHSTLGPIVQRAAARMNVAVSPDPLPHEGLFTRSDHYKFVRRGVPAVFLMTGFAGEGRRRFTGFLDDRYHSIRDDVSQPFDWNAGARFAQLNYLIAREIADGSESPLWYSDSFFGRTFGGDRARARRPSPSRQAASR